MANIVETDNWPGGVYQYADGDVLEGGPDSSEVLPLKQLAQRSLYQRLRNVTDWDAGLAAAFGYPAGAVVRHAAVSWRAKVANAVEPGTDATKWERWAYSESELAAYLRGSLLSPVRCAVTGPAAVPSAASPYTMWQSVAPYNEYWMWMGDAWKVVANRYITSVGTASSTLTANVLKSIVSVTAPRAGSAYLRAILSHANAANTLTVMSGYIRRTRAGVTTDVQDTLTVHHTTLGTQYSQCRPMAPVTVEAGDVYTLVALATQNMDPTPTNASTIYLEYLQ